MMVWLRHWALSLATFWHWDKTRLVAFQIWFRHWALSLASLWHWDKERLVAFQRDVFGFDIGLCPWLRYGIGTRSAWLHSNGINVQGQQLTHQFFCEHFSDTLGDVVASFPFGEADSSVTAAIQKVLSCCNKTGNEFIWEARFVPYFCAGFLLLAAIAGLRFIVVNVCRLACQTNIGLFWFHLMDLLYRWFFSLIVGEYLLSSWIAALSNFSYRLQTVVVW